MVKRQTMSDNDLVKRGEIKAFRRSFVWCGYLVSGVTIEDIDCIPAVDAKPVVRGEWIYKERHEHYPSGKPYTARYCGECGRRDHNEDSDYCGYCGAYMRQEQG